jgi:plastocyanin domain-containing protein
MKYTVLAIIVAMVLIGGALVFEKNDSNDSPVDGANVSVVDGKQIIEISAKGGYKPYRSVAQAGMPTIIRFSTRGTFDCSASVRIPKKNITQLLPQSGKTDIDIGISEAGILQGSCGMGMYPFEIDFQ